MRQGFRTSEFMFNAVAYLVTVAAATVLAALGKVTENTWLLVVTGSGAAHGGLYALARGRAKQGADVHIVADDGSES